MFSKILKIMQQVYARFKVFLTFLIPLAIGMIMLSISWRKWSDPIIDFGREAYIPWRISNGGVLYKEIAYLFGPLSAYVDALLFKIFGASLMVLIILNIILIIILSFILYRIFLATTNKLTATAAVSLFLAIFAFSQYTGVGNYNFVCPYVYGITHGIFLSFLIIYVFLIYLEKPSHKLIYGIGVLLGLVFLAKQEVFLAIGIAVFLGISFLMFMEKAAIRRCLKIWSMLLLGFLTPLAFFAVYLCASMPLDKVLTTILLPYASIFNSSVTSNLFYKHVMGVDVLGQNIWKILSVANCYLLVIVAFGLINNLLFWGISSKKWALVSAVTLLSLILIFSVFPVISMACFQIFRALPLTTLFLAACLFVALLHARNDRKKVHRLLPLLMMSVFAFCLLLKIIFRVNIAHYGFALALPATLLLVTILLYYLPIYLERTGRKAYFFQALSLILLGFVLLAHMNVSKRIYNLKAYAIGSGRDALFSFKYHPMTVGAVDMQQAIDKIEKMIKKTENFVVFPEGVMLNYLTRRINPTPHINFCPPEIEIFKESLILKSLANNMPDYFILIHRKMSEYGCPAPGKYWGYNIRSWIDSNYTPIFTSAGGLLMGRGYGFTIVKRTRLLK